MKSLLTLTCCIMCAFHLPMAQSINWFTPYQDKDKILYLNVGYDFGLTTQVGFGQRINAFSPLWLTIDLSTPMGRNIMDDFKSRIGGQLQLFHKYDFALSIRTYGNIRRHQTDFVRMYGFGSEISGVVSYCRAKWHAELKLGFDKSIVTHIEHSTKIQENYPQLSNGWFIPSGGHWFYGVLASRSVGTGLQLSLDLGITNAQGSDQNALLPRYVQLGMVKML